MESILKKYPELFEITKFNSINYIIYGKKFEADFINSLSWIYKNYFNNDVLIFLPKIYEFESEYNLNFTLESLEKNKYSKNTVVIFAFSEIFFNIMYKINKRRLNTQIKNIAKKCKCIILSKINLKEQTLFDLNALETFELNKVCTSVFEYSLIDLIDIDSEIFDENVQNLIQFIQSQELKQIYISLNLNMEKMLYIETKLKDNGFTVSRKENKNCQIIINSARTTDNTVLKNIYNIYILILPLIADYSDFLNYIKDIPEDAEIYMDSTKEKNIINCLKGLNTYVLKRKIIDSEEFISYNDCIKSLENIENIILATDDYYLLESSDQINNMDLSNLSKTDYEIIRNFVKFKLNSKFDIETKTCQLASPSSPKDRSKKLNSFSNKISSQDYRCEITCEIFKDYSIGVVIWNESFSKKTDFNLNENIYIYQTTTGKWKYTKIN